MQRGLDFDFSREFEPDTGASRCALFVAPGFLVHLQCARTGVLLPFSGARKQTQTVPPPSGRGTVLTVFNVVGGRSGA